MISSLKSFQNNHLITRLLRYEHRYHDQTHNGLLKFKQSLLQEAPAEEAPAAEAAPAEEAPAAAEEAPAAAAEEAAPAAEEAAPGRQS